MVRCAPCNEGGEAGVLRASLPYTPGQKPMPNVDQFESVFRSAAKDIYKRHDIPLDDALVVTDLPRDQAQTFAERLTQFMSATEHDINLMVLGQDDYRGTGELLERVENRGPSLICAYRNLHSPDYERPYSLGEHLDVLTQVASAPVLVVPNPRLSGEANKRWQNAGTSKVMVVTDHLDGDSRLIDWAVLFAANNGRLLLTHVEDDVTFRRYIEAISKIPSIDTDQAQLLIEKQLLKEPADYIESIRQALAADGVSLTIKAHVAMGHRLGDYKRLIEENEAGLLVLNTRDEDQLAMHGLAYPLAVELRDVPMLML